MKLRIEADERGEVLVPTDVGMSLLSAFNHDPSISVEGARVLDVGCGSGLYTVAMLLAGAAHVTALDINAACTRVAVDNLARNGIDLSRVTVEVADLARLEITRPWDVVVCNPPHLPSDPAYAMEDGIDTALVGGLDGRAMYDVLLARLDELLAPRGTLLLTHSSLTDIQRTCRQLEQAGYRCRTVQVCELDIPLRRYAAHRDVLLSRLYALRSAGRAAFRGLRFEVHTIAATRSSTNEKAGES
ncbi:50S ribosomal protein L11 methyltransferase [Micromonospora sp. 4G55]|uniref:50S ribosomal protein L11 methyltransferase n=1 Tax=Micromonospora sp. 4G55 TaxID=2806102 RepID=UPI001EE49C70|nr:50S ribosomal protein L11 methyltransferase [Micromonospora sp. 4G55]